MAAPRVWDFALLPDGRRLTDETPAALSANYKDPRPPWWIATQVKTGRRALPLQAVGELLEGAGQEGRPGEEVGGEGAGGEGGGACPPKGGRPRESCAAGVRIALATRVGLWLAESRRSS